jgi:hypothetical protein
MIFATERERLIDTHLCRRQANRAGRQIKRISVLF